MFDISSARGFIFDCDGTLLDTLGAWADAEAPLFAQAGPLTQRQEDEIHAAPIEHAAEILHERYGVGKSSAAVLAHLDGFLLDFYANEAQPLPGACDFVRKACGAGVPCVVVSSSPRRFLEAGLARAGILECFRELVTTDECGCSKQDRAIYERAMEVLRAPVGATWALDDAPYAIAFMTGFGLNTIAVGNGCDARRAAELRAHATLFVESLESLL